MPHYWNRPKRTWIPDEPLRKWNRTSIHIGKPMNRAEEERILLRVHRDQVRRGEVDPMDWYLVGRVPPIPPET